MPCATGRCNNTSPAIRCPGRRRPTCPGNHVHLVARTRPDVPVAPWKLSGATGLTMLRDRPDTSAGTTNRPSAFAGFQFPPNVIVLTMRWYLRVWAAPSGGSASRTNKPIGLLHGLLHRVRGGHGPKGRCRLPVRTLADSTLARTITRVGRRKAPDSASATVDGHGGDYAVLPYASW
jgi:hypothetical protein